MCARCGAQAVALLAVIEEYHTMKKHWPLLRRVLSVVGTLGLSLLAYRQLNHCLGDEPMCCKVIARILYFIIPLAIVGVHIYIRSPLFRSEYHRLPSYAMAYHAYLVAQYREVRQRQNLPTDDLVEKIAAETDWEKLKWQDLFTLELWVQNRLTPEELARKSWLLRRRYEVVSGKKTFQAYRDSAPPEVPAAGAATAEPKDLRADLAFLLQDLYWMYEIRTAWGKGRDSISKYIGWFLMVTTLALGTIAVARTLSCHPPGGSGLLLIYETVMMGATGGLVSLWRRLQVTPAADRRLDGILEFEHGRMTIMFQSFISGAIFAFVLLLIFASGLADGTLFPALKKEGASLLGMLEAASGDGTKVAKLLVWSFVAGFAERFVPDFLDRLTKSASQTEAGDGSGREPAKS